MTHGDPMTDPSPTRWRSVLLVGVLALVATAYVYPRRYSLMYAVGIPLPPPPPLPAQPPPKAPFADAPPELREFFAKAKATDSIADPLARCLAFPDWPGNRWPAGLAQAQCHEVFGPRLDVATLRKHFERGDYAGLDALFQRDLDRHFTAGHDEVIHRDFDLIGGGTSWDTFTQQWLRARPDSAFALAARAHYLESAAWKARGDKTAAETTPEALRVMGELAEQGIDVYRRALAKEPRLLPAYEGILDLAKLIGRDDIKAGAIAAAAKIDPDDYRVAAAAVEALSPRWSGDHRQFVAYMTQLYPRVPGRPLLALAVSGIAADLGEDCLCSGDVEGSVEVLAEAAPMSSAPAVQVGLARAYLHSPGAHALQALSLLIAASRYQTPHGWYPSFVGGELMMENEHAWAVDYLERAQAAEPDNEDTAEFLHVARLELERASQPAPTPPPRF
jgi:hypothetical protein